MADLAYRRDAPLRLVTDWGAIWAGVFAYFAIWAVFLWLAARTVERREYVLEQ